VGRTALARHVRADRLAETLAELEQKTREYQDTLARVRAREEQAVVRAAATAERYRILHAEGLVARRDMEDAKHAVAAAPGRLDERGTSWQTPSGSWWKRRRSGAWRCSLVPGRGAIDAGRARLPRRFTDLISTPARSWLRTAVRRESCGIRPGTPAFAQAVSQARRKFLIRDPQLSQR